MIVATGIAFLYTAIGGLWGVVLTDFFQFVLAMVGSISLAVYAVAGAGGVGALQQSLAGAGRESAVSFFPSGAGTLAPILFFVYIGLLWWANPNADGGGMLVQRMAA